MGKFGEQATAARPAVEFVVPTDSVNEQVIIAAAVVDAKVRAELVRTLQPEHFLVPEHRPIWSGLQEMERRKLAYDPAVLQRLVGDKVDISYVTQLEALRPDVPDNLAFHIDALHWDKQRLTVVAGPLSSLIDAIRNPREAPERVRALARHVGDAFRGKSGAGQFLLDPAELVRTQLLEIEKRIAGHACYPYGIKGLDFYEDAAIDADGKLVGGQPRMLPGAAPGKVTVLTGVPGGGKSTTAGHLALGLMNQGRRVLFGAWEMGGGMTLELLAALSLGDNRADLLAGRISRESLILFEERMHEISKQVVFMANPFRRSGSTKKATNAVNLDIVQAHIADSGCHVFIADLWKRCLSETQPEAEEEALYRQQAMLEEMQVHGILLQQQRSKDLEQRPDKRPTREAIKGSSAWVEVADTVIGVNLPALWKRIPNDKLEMFVLKQRYGSWPLGVEFDWRPKYGDISGGVSIEYERPGEEAVEAKERQGSFPVLTQKKKK